jgi:hypothetical protein
LFLEFIGVNFGAEAYSPALLAKVEKDTALFGNMTEGSMELPPAVTTTRAENISGETLGVNANADRLFGVNFTPDKSKVFGLIGINFIEVAIEVAKFGGHGNDLFARDQSFGASPIFNELGDRTGF